MVPDIIKRTRWKRVDETLFTAYALILVDLCSNAVAFKKARRTNGTLKGLVEFYQWANDDAPRWCGCSTPHFALESLRFACICVYAFTCEHINWY
jgi:hypothetical protein